MGKLADIFVEWVKKERLWALLIVLTLPAVVKLCQEYFQLSFRAAITHWSVLIASGTLLILSGALHSVFPTGGFKERVRLGGSFALLGSVMVLVGAFQLRPARLPSNHLVVAITRFTPVTAAARDDADNLSHLLEQRLRERQRAGLPLEVKRLPVEVSGSDEHARHEAAVAIAMSRDGGAHVVIWGDVRKDEGQLYVEPRLTVARALGKELPEERSIGTYTSEGPSHITFKQQLSTDVTDMVGFTYGLAQFNAGYWQKAADIFLQSRSPANRLYYGMSLQEVYREHFQKTFDYKTRLPLLDSAEAEITGAYQALMDAKDWNLATLSLLRLGDALRLHTKWGAALERYDQAEALARRTQNPTHEAAAHIGQARTKLLGKEELETTDLQGALKDIEQAVSLYKRSNDTIGLFRALDWKASMQEEQGNLGTAIETLNHAFSLAPSLDDRGLLYNGYLDRAGVYYKMLTKYTEEQNFAKAYSAADSAESDYQKAIPIAESLGWEGLAQAARQMLANVNSGRRIASMEESLTTMEESLATMEESRTARRDSNEVWY
jgi:tetratricopeptide (TPR) repeat protein